MCCWSSSRRSADDLRRGGDPRERHPSDGHALHARGGQREQVRDLGRRHQAAGRWDERAERAREAAAVEAPGGRSSTGGEGGSRRGGTAPRRRPSCTTSGLSAAMTVSSQNRLRFWVRSAARISARLNVDVSPPSGSPQRSWRTSLFSWRRYRRRASSSKYDGVGVSWKRTIDGAPDRDLGAGDLLERRGRLLARRRRSASRRSCAPCETASRTPARAATPGRGQRLLAVDAAEPDVGVGGADRAVERGHRLAARSGC